MDLWILFFSNHWHWVEKKGLFVVAVSCHKRHSLVFFNMLARFL